MQTNRVIETFEVRKDGRAGLPVRLERHAVDTLTSECVKEGLHGRIVVTVGRAAHADFDAHLGQKGLIAHRRELKPIVTGNLLGGAFPGDAVEPTPEIPADGASVAWGWGRKNVSSGADTIGRVLGTTGRARPHASAWCNR